MYVSGINSSGQVIGNQYIASGNVNSAYPFLYSGGTTTALASSGLSSVWGINDLGVLAGNSGGSVVLYNGTPQNLGVPAGSSGGWGAINNAGQIAFTGQNADHSGFHHAFVYDGTFHDIGSLNPGDNDVVANDINNLGQVVGSSSYYPAPGTGTGQAILYDGTMHGLGTLPGFDQGDATAINDSGQIVGFAFNPTSDDSNTYRAFFYDGTMHDLGAPGVQSIAEDINNSGVVVGESFLEGVGWHAFLYSGGVVYDSNHYLAASGYGWTVQFAIAINESGQIAVYGTSGSGSLEGAILTPCPTCEADDDNDQGENVSDPASTLLLLGTALSGLAWARRKWR